jgi:chromosome segregation ATPase
MKLFDNKKTQPKVEAPKQSSSEIEKLKKQNRELKRSLELLRSDVDDIEKTIRSIGKDIQGANSERWENVENKLRDYVDRNAERWVGTHIDMKKIEDTVLLKVVKATFNNYKDGS